MTQPSKPLPPKHVLLRCSWQSVNIGDVAHTPGVLALLEEHAPEVKVHLWPLDGNPAVLAMIRGRFPRVRVVESSEDVRDARERCDFLLHGSGPYAVAEDDLRRWRAETGKPFGVFGITLGGRRSSQTRDIDPRTVRATVDLLSDADFVYFRDSVSLGYAKEHSCESPVMAFGPDGAFACDVRDDPAAEAFHREYELERGRYLCCIPRLRYTPGWEFASKNKPVDPVKDRRNRERREHDHAPLLDAIRRVVAETDLKVLICPEDQTQVKLGRETLFDPLAPELRDRVVLRDRFWLTDEALSVYEGSAGLFGNEMHSPILCVGRGVPAIVCRWAEQSSKGVMWRDIGLGEWLFDLDEPEQARAVAPAVLAMAKHPKAARKKAEAARDRVAELQAGMVTQLRRSLGIA